MISEAKREWNRNWIRNRRKVLGRSQISPGWYANPKAWSLYNQLRKDMTREQARKMVLEIFSEQNA